MVPEALRICFRKTGKLQFISHLDLMRTMTTALVRSGIPVYYSEGFNPHPKISFALPLSIGAESVCEFMDMKLAEEMSREEVIRRLNRALPVELAVTEVWNPEHKCSEIGWASYELTLDRDFDADTFFGAPIVIQKRTKSGGAKEIDVLPQIRTWKKEDRRLTLLLAASSQEYLNPEYIAKALGLADYSILRTAVYLADGVTPFR